MSYYGQRGIFSNPATGGVSLGDAVTDGIQDCIKNMMAAGYDESFAKKDCGQFYNKAVECAPQCQAHRPDSPEWAQCIQRCHGYTPVDYSSDKRKCEAEGKTYSWLEGGCVDTQKMESCPPGTMYASYPDGSEKCIGYVVDLRKAECPPGTTLKKVPGGETCVSPVKPTATPKPTSTIKIPSIPGVITKKTEPTKAGFLGLPTIAWIGGAAVVGVAALLLAAKDPKKKKPTSAAPNQSYRVGERVQLHPATDRWMMGDRYGEVVATPKTKRGSYKVLMDKSGKTISVRERDLVPIASRNSGYQLKPGYAYMMRRKTGWQVAADDAWDTVMQSGNSRARFVGTRMIDDTRCAVFKAPNGFYYAQVYQVARSA